MIQISLGVNRQLLTEHKEEISNGVNRCACLARYIAEIASAVAYINHTLCACELCTYSLARCKTENRRPIFHIYPAK